jgi:hypothetical protein
MADAALYQAKRGGKGCVKVAGRDASARMVAGAR